jgi:drug/metabolite transporter (DMT)-like permease
MASTDTSARLESGLAGPLLALCAGAVAMGISPIFVRYASADVGPFASAFWRVALALPVLYAWMRLEEARAPVGAPRRSFSCGIVLAGLAFAGDLFFWHLSIMGTTVANATFFATTAPVFVVLVFVITSTVGGLLLAMAPDRPVVSALAIAVMSAPLAAVAGAAVLHGVYFCEWASRCFAGVIPY